MISKLTRALAALALAAGGAGSAAAQATNTPGTTPQNQQQLNPQSSHPGVQGMPGNKSGPATRAPGENAPAGASSGSSTGTSTGTGGSSSMTQPTQDSSKVPGVPGNKSGPSQRPPGQQ